MDSPSQLLLRGESISLTQAVSVGSTRNTKINLMTEGQMPPKIITSMVHRDIVPLQLHQF